MGNTVTQHRAAIGGFYARIQKLTPKKLKERPFLEEGARRKVSKLFLPFIICLLGVWLCNITSNHDLSESDHDKERLEESGTFSLIRRMLRLVSRGVESNPGPTCTFLITLLDPPKIVTVTDSKELTIMSSDVPVTCDYSIL